METYCERKKVNKERRKRMEINYLRKEENKRRKKVESGNQDFKV